MKWNLYQAARNPYVWTPTTEDDRVIREERRDLPKDVNMVSWDIVRGFRILAPNGSEGSFVWQPLDPEIQDPAAALASIGEQGNKVGSLGETVFVMYDFHKFFQEITITRAALSLKDYLKANGKMLAFVSPTIEIPIEMSEDVVVTTFPLPDKDELTRTLDSFLEDQDMEASPEDRRSLIGAMQGLTREAAENALAYSLARDKKLFYKSVLEQKVAILKATGVLEYGQFKETFADLYGLEVMSNFAIRTIGSGKAKCMLIYGVPGCIAGDAEIIILRGKRKGGRKTTLEKAYYRFNNIPRPGKGQYRKWDGEAYAPAWLGDRVGYNKVEEIIYSGVKDVYRVITSGGKSIKTTLDHPFMVPNGGDEEGFLPLDRLHVGDEICVRQLDLKNGGKKKRRTRKEVCTKFHPYGRHREINGCNYRFVRRARASVEAEMNNITLDEFVNRLKVSSLGLKFLPEKVVIHHKDGDELNDVPENLEVLSSIKEHNELHPNMWSNFGNQNMEVEKIASIEYIGKEKTYDIKMAEPYRNMVVNDFVVHNCGKSLFAKALANELKRAMLIANFNALRGKFQGDAEGRAELMFNTIQAFGDSIVFADEFDKSIAGTGSSETDGGVGMRILQKTLTYFEDRPPGGEYWICTANSLDDILNLSGGALVRRFDIMFFVDLPTKKEALGIANIWNKKCNVTIPADFDFKGWSGADIAKLARTMDMLQCPADDAKKFVIPTQEALGDKIGEIRKAASRCCIWATEGDESTPTNVKRRVRM